MNKFKGEKIQVLLSSTDHHRLKNMIIEEAVKTGKLVSISSYVRNLIIEHINVGEQSSYVKNDINQIIKKTENKNERI